ncbi:MAG: UDP-N-acetylglucosamine 2-epimerase (non-hydrolyzing) [Gammaproteobacteria bacterium]|nr:MAG: UDP-N-acetylglucosamine 2-epimerase (non-hydrolyzing) [Gammaproteobacteria bacterium]
MKDIKVATVVGTRPEIIRLSRVISRLEDHCNHILIHTGQNYDFELNEIFFNELDIRKPDHFLAAAGESAADTIGNVIKYVDKVLQDIKPDALLILGDTNSCLAAIPAKRRKIPVFHMEAGNRCFDQRVPEEINRKIVDHIADVNMPYSSIAREYLLNEGVPADRIIKTGSPMNEVLNHYKDNIDESAILEKLDLRSREYFVFSVHREENVDSEVNLATLVDVMNNVAKEYGFPIIVSLHPRTKKNILRGDYQFSPLIRFEKPFGFLDYIHLQKHSTAVISDSGTITEESSILRFPALNIRDNHERPEGMEEASVIMTGLDKERVMQSLALLLSQVSNDTHEFNVPSDYLADNVSNKVLRIIFSYIGYVNRRVWGQR